MKKKMSAFSLIFAVLLGAVACSSSTGSSGESWEPEKAIEIVAPAGAGGGWDTTARMAAQVLQEEGIIKQNIGVVNKSGGGGAVGWAYVHEKKGDNHTLFVTSPPIILVPLTGQSKLGHEDFTPIANLIADYAAFVVRSDAKWNNLNELFEDMKKDPASVTVVGASAPGSMDHMQFIKVAKAAGVDITKIKYVSIQDGGALPALLNGSADVYSTGIAESVEQARAGNVKVLGITSEKRLEGEILSEFPTVKEQGIDVTFVNWRGFFGPPEMPPNVLAYYQQKFKELNDNPKWEEICKKYGWNKFYMQGDEYKQFLDREKEQFQALLEELGLAK